MKAFQDIHNIAVNNSATPPSIQLNIQSKTAKHYTYQKKIKNKTAKHNHQVDRFHAPMSICSLILEILGL